MFVEEKREGEIRPITPPLEPWQQTLLEAAQYLRVKGWTRGTYCDNYGKRCIIGALMAIEGKDAANSTHPLYKKVTKWLNIAPEHWNDVYARGALGVIHTLEAIALTTEK